MSLCLSLSLSMCVCVCTKRVRFSLDWDGYAGGSFGSRPGTDSRSPADFGPMSASIWPQG